MQRLMRRQLTDRGGDRGGHPLTRILSAPLDMAADHVRFAFEWYATGPREEILQMNAADEKENGRVADRLDRDSRFIGQRTIVTHTTIDAQRSQSRDETGEEIGDSDETYFLLLPHMTDLSKSGSVAFAKRCGI